MTAAGAGASFNLNWRCSSHSSSARWMKTEPSDKYHTCRIWNDGWCDNQNAGSANVTSRIVDASNAGLVLPSPCIVLDPTKMIPLATKFQLTIRRYSDPKATTAGS